ncbi:MAG: hypothetical protein ORN98_02005 [Alphaproteobacteria bacterium]|nr:hypothetical protein [Alphaproteobacteria bacterium]
MTQLMKPAMRGVCKAGLRKILVTALSLRFGMMLILLAVTLSSCVGLLECPSEFGTPASRARWCGPGGAGQ